MNENFTQSNWHNCVKIHAGTNYANVCKSVVITQSKQIRTNKMFIILSMPNVNLNAIFSNQV